MGRSNCAHFPCRRELLEVIHIEKVDGVCEAAETLNRRQWAIIGGQCREAPLGQADHPAAAAASPH
ncbi:MAG TPA: hypothetical protein VF940_16695 [Streptosporangiaceae bacterium]